MFIGIDTCIVAEKKRVMREFSDLDKFRAALTRQFNAHGIYDLTEDEYEICLRLREYEYAKVYVNHILLSVAGKILMEYYDRMFAFFTRLVRERMASYKLADSLFVYITE